MCENWLTTGLDLIAPLNPVVLSHVCLSDLSQLLNVWVKYCVNKSNVFVSLSPSDHSSIQFFLSYLSYI